MHIEVISRLPLRGEPKPTPLLFVHGAYGAAWTWDQHFLPYFAEHGFAAHAVSLRGHGASEGWESLPVARLKDFVADVLAVARDLPAPPVLIGHSMGGMVVQKALYAMSVPAAVLMASVPPHGLISSMLGMAFCNPPLFQEMSTVQAMGPAAVNGYLARKALFSDSVDDDVVDEYLRRFQPESQLVILDLMGCDLPPSTPSLDLPVLVLGAQNDNFVFAGAVAATAQTYRTRPEIFPGMAHAMMLDHDWEKVAARIVQWLDATLPVGAAGRERQSRPHAG
jgi:pimeloyl-ACP methyl ester carboxylesterase